MDLPYAPTQSTPSLTSTPTLLRYGPQMALAGELTTLQAQHQPKLSCVRETCAQPGSGAWWSMTRTARTLRSQPDLGFFAPTNSRRGSRTRSTLLTPAPTPAPRPRSFVGCGGYNNTGTTNAPYASHSHPYFLVPPPSGLAAVQRNSLSPHAMYASSPRPNSVPFAVPTTCRPAWPPVPSPASSSSSIAAAVPKLTTRVGSPPDDGLPTPALGVPELALSPSMGSSPGPEYVQPPPRSIASAPAWRTTRSPRGPTHWRVRSKAQALPVLTTHTVYASPMATDTDRSYTHWRPY